MTYCEVALEEVLQSEAQALGDTESVHMSSTRSSGQADHLVTVKEALRVLHISRGTLYKEVNAGRLLKVKVGRATRFTSSSLQDFIQARMDESRSRFTNRPGQWS